MSHSINISGLSGFFEEVSQPQYSKYQQATLSSPFGCQQYVQVQQQHSKDDSNLGVQSISSQCDPSNLVKRESFEYILDADSNMCMDRKSSQVKQKLRRRSTLQRKSTGEQDWGNIKGVPQKRYRVNQKNKMMDLEAEVLELQRKLNEKRQINRNLKEKNSEQQQLRNKQCENMQAMNLNLEDSEDDSNQADEGQVKINIPKLGKLTEQQLLNLDFETVVQIYKDWYYLFKNQLLQIEGSDGKLMAYENLKHSVSNYELFISCLRQGNHKMFYRLLMYDFERQFQMHRDGDALQQWCSQVADILNLSEEQIYSTYILRKILITDVQYRSSQLENKLKLVNKEYELAQIQNRSQGDSLNAQLMLALVDFRTAYLEMKLKLKQLAQLDIRKWLEAHQIAKVVVYTYPQTPCFKTLGFYYRNLYCESNQEEFNMF